MVLITKTDDSKKKIASTRRLCTTTFLGLVLLIIPITLFYVNPVLLIVQNKLRLENGSMLNEVLLRRFKSTKMYLSLFNVTNSERFLSGADEKVKLEEIGPFFYQEYRSNGDLEINKDPGIMRYTPVLENVFIPEESIGDPKLINVTVPRMSMLVATSLMSKYPFIVRQVFNVVAASNKMGAFVNLRAYDHIWGYSDPLIHIANTVVPGLVYFKSVGLFERFHSYRRLDNIRAILTLEAAALKSEVVLQPNHSRRFLNQECRLLPMYDVDVDYRLEIGTENQDKFSVKKATKIQATTKKKPSSENNNEDARALVDNTFEYNNTYEGAAFPPSVTPQTPIHIYRYGLCKTFHLQYVGSKRMPYGGDGFVYHFHNDTFRDRRLCDTKGWCPEGLKDLSDCYFGFPIALSKSHFLDSDPRLLEMVEGLKPVREIHDTEIILDPQIGVGISGTMAVQLNLVLGDVGFNRKTRRLKDLVLPMCSIIAKAPPQIEEVKSVLDLTYTKGPYIIGAVQLLCTLLGLLLLSYSARMTYWNCLVKNTSEENSIAVKLTQLPLLKS